jgi:hypothetical protein
MFRPYLRWLYATPFILILVGAFSIFLRIISFIGDVETLMRLPSWFAHPLFGLLFIFAGVAWLYWVTRSEPETITLFRPDGLPYPKAKHPVVTIAAGAIVLAVTLSIPLWFYFTGSAKEVTLEKPEAPLKNTSPQTVTLLASYSLYSLLPISIPANSTAYVLQLNPAISEGFFLKVNGRSEPEIWPHDYGKGMDQISICEIANPGDRTYINVAVAFNTAFFEVKNTGKKMQKTKNKDGSITYSGQWTAGKNNSFFFNTDGEIFESGRLLKSFLHPVTIPLIEPRQKVKIYLINQSRFF